MRLSSIYHSLRLCFSCAAMPMDLWRLGLHSCRCCRRGHNIQCGANRCALDIALQCAPSMPTGSGCASKIHVCGHSHAVGGGLRSGTCSGVFACPGAGRSNLPCVAVDLYMRRGGTLRAYSIHTLFASRSQQREFRGQGFGSAPVCACETACGRERHCAAPALQRQLVRVAAAHLPHVWRAADAAMAEREREPDMDRALVRVQPFEEERAGAAQLGGGPVGRSGPAGHGAIGGRSVDRTVRRSGG